jgi:hypothetical protein
MIPRLATRTSSARSELLLLQPHVLDHDAGVDEVELIFAKENRAVRHQA